MDDSRNVFGNNSSQSNLKIEGGNWQTFSKRNKGKEQSFTSDMAIHKSKKFA